MPESVVVYLNKNDGMNDVERDSLGWQADLDQFAMASVAMTVEEA